MGEVRGQRIGRSRVQSEYPIVVVNVHGEEATLKGNYETRVHGEDVSGHQEGCLIPVFDAPGITGLSAIETQSG
jgi:hypothetical protein